METKSKNSLMIGLLLVAGMFCLAALYAGFDTAFWTKNPETGKNVTDLFHGIPAIACAGYCLYICVKNIVRLRKND